MIIFKIGFLGVYKHIWYMSFFYPLPEMNSKILLKLAREFYLIFKLVSRVWRSLNWHSYLCQGCHQLPASTFLANNSGVLCVGHVCRRPVYVCSLLYRSMIKYILLCSLRQQREREIDRGSGREGEGEQEGEAHRDGYCWNSSATCSRY